MMRALKRTLMLAGMAVGLGLASVASGQGSYSVANGWPKLPAGYMLGQIAGVGVDSRNTVIVFNRAENSWSGEGPLGPVRPIPSPTVLGFDGKTGALVFSWGAGTFVHPHALRVDSHDNIWLSDDGLQQVFKYSRDGKLLMTIGTAGVVGCDATHFNGPTDIAVTPDGSFYVADGYGSSRIAKFSADGRFLFAWGNCSKVPLENVMVYASRAKFPGYQQLTRNLSSARRYYDGPGEFNTPHNIVIDPKSLLLYVADRDNARIQVFDGTGKFVRTLSSPEMGRPWSIAFGPDDMLYVVDGGDLADGPSAPDHPFREAILKIDLSGKVLQKWSGFGNQNGLIFWGHDIAVGKDRAVYVGDVGHGMRVQKFVPDGARK